MSKFSTGIVVRKRPTDDAPPLFLLTLGEDIDMGSTYFSGIVLLNGDKQAQATVYPGRISIWPNDQFEVSSFAVLAQLDKDEALN